VQSNDEVTRADFFTTRSLAQPVVPPSTKFSLSHTLHREILSVI
jgi:hypothetical protein